MMDVAIEHLVVQIEEKKRAFYEKYGCNPNVISLGKKQIRELSEYSYLAKNIDSDMALAEVKEHVTRWSHLTICGLHLESLLTPLGACILKGNRDLEPMTYYESNRASQFTTLPEDDLTVRYLPPNFSWLEQHTAFSKKDIEVLQNEL